MPGILGVVRPSTSSEGLSRRLASMLHLPSYEAQEFEVSDGVRLAHVARRPAQRNTFWHFDAASTTGVLLYGPVFRSQPFPHRVGPVEFLNGYLESGTARWADWDGGFVAAVVDLRARRLLLGNSRLGMLPMFFRRKPDSFDFASEIKPLLVDGGPRYSHAGLITFLAAGFCLGETTPFDGVHALEPGTMISVGLDDLSFRKERFWTVRYAPDRELHRRRDAEAALLHAVENAHRVLLSDAPSRVDLLLSGGLDSRGILAVMERIGRRPDQAMSFGLTCDIPESDAWTARRLAEEYGVPFRFMPYDTDGFVEHAARWSELSELANDNPGWHAEASGVLEGFHDAQTVCTLVGDEVWGSRGFAHDDMEVRIGAEVPATLPASLTAVLKPQQLRWSLEAFDAEVRKVLAACDDPDLNNRKDFLYIHGRVARYISSIGYYRELYTEIRRPFLMNEVVEVVRRLPLRFRLHKNLYVSMLRRLLPKAMVVPDKMVSSLPDWELDVRTRPSLRARMLDLLSDERLASGPLGELIDAGRLAALRDVHFAETPSPLSRQISARERARERVFARLLELPSYTRMAELPKRLGLRRRRTPVNRSDVLRRVALVHLFADRMSKSPAQPRP
jgi:asparagine synthetase B (glutamine-hydrolysing)